MNVFCIPSWYPSKSNSLYGIFIKEEIELLAKYHPDINFGVSFWGQGDDSSLIWSRQPLRSIRKLLTPLVSQRIQLRDNLVEYRNPVYIWSRKILRGNLKNIFRANEKNLMEFWQKFKGVDVIHVQASYPGIMMASCLSNKYGIPYIVTSHMSPFPFKEFLKRGQIVRWLRIPLQGAFKIIATSHSAEKVINSFGFDRTTVIPITRDLDYFKQVKSLKLNPPRILAIGRLVKQKGFDILLNALRSVNDDFLLHVVGDGPESQSLKNLSNSLGLSKKIIWKGELNREEVLKEMQECSFFVLSSRHETFGNVVVEAAACGRPVIATRCGGPEDIVTDEIGLLVEKEDVKALSNGLITMIKKHQTYDPKKIREVIEKKFDPKQITAMIREVYEEATTNNT